MITILLWLNTLIWLNANIKPLVIFSLVLQVIWLLIIIKEGLKK